MATMRTCDQCGTDTATYVECCGTVLCADYADPRSCAERHFGNHTWCKLCLAFEDKRSLATHQFYWPGTPEPDDLCQECAEYMDRMVEQHGLDGFGTANPLGSEARQEPADERPRGGRRQPSTRTRRASTLTGRYPLVHYQIPEMTAALCDLRKPAQVTDSEAEVTCERCVGILRFPIFRYSPGREKYLREHRGS